MQKFNPSDWRKVDADEEIELVTGELQLRSTHEIKVFIQNENDVALLGVGHTFKAEFATPVLVNIDGPKSAETYIKYNESVIFHTEGEIFTNMDKRPEPSEAQLAVTRALKELEKEKRRIQRLATSLELKEERRANARERREREREAPAAATPDTPAGTAPPTADPVQDDQ